jgi:protein-tyrosine phosphatase
VRAPTAASRQAAPTDDRHLDRDGCVNVRDLAGLPTAGGRVTRRGALVRDRTGLVSIVVLALLGVAPEHIAADDALSAQRLSARHTALGTADDGPVLEPFLAERGTTAEALVADLLETLHLEALLRDGGLTDGDLEALRARLLEEPASAKDAA